jgi:hypothetical protein
MSINHSSEKIVFTKRVDFYWQFATIYAFVLLIYVILKGTYSEEGFSLTIVFVDPLFILLAVFTIFSFIGLFLGILKKHIIEIGNDFIIFKTRFRQKRYNLEEIKNITFGKSKITRFPSAHRLIKFRVKGRNRLIRIRPSSFWNEVELVESITELKRKLNV